MSRNIIFLIVSLIFPTGCNMMPDKALTACRTMNFTDEVRLPVTPVKNQGRSDLCWIYAMLATIETDRITRDDSVNLSPDYAARAWIDDRTLRSYFSKGQIAVTMRGMATTLFTVLEKQGAMPYDSYNNGETNYKILCRKMTHMASKAKTLDLLKQQAGNVMDNDIGPLPKNVYMLGAEYSPGQFATSIAQRNDYEAITSFTHHPWGTAFAIETPDNVMVDKFMNIPVDSLMTRIVNALHAGNAVCWEGDVTESGFSFEHGIATFKSNKPCSQAYRQREFEQMRTTDDHCMTITGMARDKDGQRYFIAKNSWGTNNPYGGMIYMSENYVRMKTIAIVTRRLEETNQ